MFILRYIAGVLAQTEAEGGGRGSSPKSLLNVLAVDPKPVELPDLRKPTKDYNNGIKATPEPSINTGHYPHLETPDSLNTNSLNHHFL